MLELIPDTGSELDCREFCREMAGCEYYTFYLNNSPNYGTCVLLSSLQEPIED